LRDLSRWRVEFSVSLASLKPRALAVLDRIFPKWTRLWSTPWGPTARAVWAAYPTPAPSWRPTPKSSGPRSLPRVMDGWGRAASPSCKRPPGPCLGGAAPAARSVRRGASRFPGTGPIAARLKRVADQLEADGDLGGTLGTLRLLPADGRAARDQLARGGLGANERRMGGCVRPSRPAADPGCEGKFRGSGCRPQVWTALESPTLSPVHAAVSLTLMDRNPGSHTTPG
jgi:hypothetical protein